MNELKRFELADEIVRRWRRSFSSPKVSQFSLFQLLTMLRGLTYPYADMIAWAEMKYNDAPKVLYKVYCEKCKGIASEFFLWWYTQTRNEYEAYDPNVKERLQQSLKELKEIL